MMFRGSQFLLYLLLLSAAPFAYGERKLDFGREVRPILSAHCYECHGPDEKQRVSELRLDRREQAFAKSEGQAALVAGDTEASQLVQRITASDPEERMPPARAKNDLSAEQRATLVRWVREGAAWPDHWAFTPPVASKPPVGDETKRAENEIDAFVHAELHQQKLSPSPEADRRMLQRRVTLDLTGLPPTREEIQAFLADDSPQAYQRLVDRLLESDACAERLAMDWLDVARFADSHGLHADGARTNWQWRDWVIAAFRRNAPYDEFITWQLAGDLLPGATRDQRLATAFLRNHVMSSEGGVVDEEYRWNYVFDRVETVGSALLGLTMQCCRCHDHKFDPLTQRDYFALASLFDNQQELGMIGDDGDFGPAIDWTDEVAELRLAELDKLLSVQDAKLTALRSAALPPAKTPKVAIPTPVLYLPFDGLKNVVVGEEKKEESRLDGNVDATHGDPPKFISGVAGQAANIRGEYGSFEVAKLPQPDVADPFSAALWVLPNDRPAHQLGKCRQFLGNAADKNELWRGWEFFLDPQDRLSFTLVARLPDNQIRVRSVAPVPNRQWTQVAFTYDGSGRAAGVRLFINGRSVPVEVEFDSLTRSIYPVTNLPGRPKEAARYLKIGRSHRSFTGDFGIYEGAFDDLKMFSAGLSELEIAELFNSYAHGERAPQTTELQQQHALLHSAAWRAAEANRRVLLAARVEVLSALPAVMVFQESPQPRDTPLLARGQYDSPGEIVPANVPAVLGQLPSEAPRNRLALAEWMFGAENPVVARVAVNHYWQLIMGEGLTAKPDDLGTQAPDPLHRELLDTLAVRFRASGWDVRGLLRQIVTSQTYRQTSVQNGPAASPTAELARELDPANRLWWRGASRRLSAETLRDAALAASGLLVPRIGGPSVKPYQPAGIWEEKSSFSQDLMTYQQDHGESLYRRSMYTYLRRTAPPPAMTALDAPNRSTCTVKRETTNTPLQALVLLNDPQFVEAARCLAQNLLGNESLTDEERISQAFEQLAARPPSTAEAARFAALFKATLSRFQTQAGEAQKLLTVGEQLPPSSVNHERLAALTVVTSTMINYDAFYSRR